MSRGLKDFKPTRSWIDSSRKGKYVPVTIMDGLQRIARTDVYVCLKGNVAVSFPRALLENSSPIFSAMLKCGTLSSNVLDLVNEDAFVVYHALFLLRDGSSPSLSFLEAIDVLHFAHKYAIRRLVMSLSPLVESRLDVHSSFKEYLSSQLTPRLGRYTVMKHAQFLLRDERVIDSLPLDCLIDIASSDQAMISESLLLKVILAWGEKNPKSVELEEFRQLVGSDDEKTNASSETSSIVEAYLPGTAAAQSMYQKVLDSAPGAFGEYLKPLLKFVRFQQLGLRDVALFMDQKKIISEKSLMSLYSTFGLQFAGKLSSDTNLNNEGRKKHAVKFLEKSSKVVRPEQVFALTILLSTIRDGAKPVRLKHLYDLSDGDSRVWNGKCGSLPRTIILARIQGKIFVVYSCIVWNTGNSNSANEDVFIAGISEDGNKIIKCKSNSSFYAYYPSHSGPIIASSNFNDVIFNSAMNLTLTRGGFTVTDPNFDQDSLTDFFPRGTIIPTEVETWQIEA